MPKLPGSDSRHTAQRTGIARAKPPVNAVRMEDVLALGQLSHPLPPGKVLQADRAAAGLHTSSKMRLHGEAYHIIRLLGTPRLFGSRPIALALYYEPPASVQGDLQWSRVCMAEARQQSRRALLRCQSMHCEAISLFVESVIE